MNIIKSTIFISFFTFISRIFGYIRDVVIAAELGADMLNDIFIAAFKLANLFRNLFGEGAFNSAFVPIFAGRISTKGFNNARSLAKDVQAILLSTVVIFSISFIIFMPLVINLTTPGFVYGEREFALTVELARITFPYLILISLVAFYGSMLNSIGKFLPFAMTPIFLNIVLIIFALYYDTAATKAHALSYGVLYAGVIELIWVLTFAKLNNLLLPIAKPRFTPEIKLIMKKMLSGIIGSGMAQINTWVDMVIASFVAGGMSYLYFADRIMQLPLALVGTAAATILLPTLAREFTNGNWKAAIDMQNVAIKFTLFFSIPAMTAIIYLAYDIVSLLFEHGKFTASSTKQTARALIGFTIGLPAFMLVKIFVSSFYARGDMKTPVKIAGFCILINAIISIALFKSLQHVGIALASSFSAWINISILIFMAYSTKYYRIEKTDIVNILKYLVASLIMLVNLIVTCNILHNYPLSRFILMVVYVLVGATTYIVTCYLLKAIRISDLKLY